MSARVSTIVNMFRSASDLEIVLEQIQHPVGLDLVFQAAKSVIEFRSFTLNWKVRILCLLGSWQTES